MGKRTALYPNLIAELARRSMTLTELAERLGISRATLYNKLYGISNLTLKDITTIQEILKSDNDGDLSLDYLFQTKAG